MKKIYLYENEGKYKYEITSIEGKLLDEIISFKNSTIDVIENIDLMESVGNFDEVMKMEVDVIHLIDKDKQKYSSFKVKSNMWIDFISLEQMSGVSIAGAVLKSNYLMMNKKDLFESILTMKAVRDSVMPTELIYDVLGDYLESGDSLVENGIGKHFHESEIIEKQIIAIIDNTFSSEYEPIYISIKGLPVESNETITLEDANFILTNNKVFLEETNVDEEMIISFDNESTKEQLVLEYQNALLNPKFIRGLSRSKEAIDEIAFKKNIIKK